MMFPISLHTQFNVANTLLEGRGSDTRHVDTSKKNVTCDFYN